jgi:hypothetical protein
MEDVKGRCCLEDAGVDGMIILNGLQRIRLEGCGLGWIRLVRDRDWLVVLNEKLNFGLRKTQIIS